MLLKWLVTTFLLGLAYIFVVPPFQSPDEVNHFMRIYHISEGRLWGEVSADGHELGGYLPKDLDYTYQPFNYLPFHKENKITIDTITSHLLKPLLNKSEIEFKSFPNTARYAFTAYLPQVIVFILLKKINCPPLLLMYLGRLAVFLFWVTIVYQAIKRTPVFKEVFMVLAFLPTSMAINTTLSADVVSNALVFMVFTLFLKFKFEESSIKRTELALFGCIVTLINWQKIVYFPILFLLVLVPASKFNSFKNKILIISSLSLFNLAIIFWWSSEINKLIYPTGDKYVTTYKNMRLDADADINPVLQTEDILNDPIPFIKAFFSTSLKVYGATYESYLTSFGWEGIGIPTGLLIVFSIGFLIFILIQKNIFRLYEKGTFILLCHSLVMLFILSQHLHWDAVGDFIEYHYGGKYYIPIYPILIFALTGLLNNSVVQIGAENGRKYFNYCFLSLMLLVQIDFLIIVVERYYFLKS